jgi:hypothetical protein
MISLALADRGTGPAWVTGRGFLYSADASQLGWALFMLRNYA